MKTLADILRDITTKSITGSTDIAVSGLTMDSRTVEPGFIYFAIKGTAADGHQFIGSAIEQGAVAVICNTLPANTPEGCTYITVADPQQIVGLAASNFYEAPSEQLTLIGVTGTNGKTTTTSMLYSLFTLLGNDCGLISTVEYKIKDKRYTSTHTTPDPIRLNAMMREMADAGCSYCFMEVSSHAIVQGRINGLHFKGGVFTNITHDHLDYHGTFDQYIKAKKMFFDNLGNDAFALTNKDDKNGLVMLQNTKASRYTYSLHASSDFKLKVLESDFNGMLLKIGDDEAWFNMVGNFNAYNILAVYATAFLLDVPKHDIITKMTLLGRVNGRFEVYRSANRIVGIVDYAHTPDALQNVLNTINAIRTKNEQLVTVVGCGGNRDKTKRPVMAKIAVTESDKVILTSDNPRDEDPEQIITDMMAGVDAVNLKKTVHITDRKEAIKTAVMLCKPGDIILLAGKGHETYQEIKGVKSPFDDRLILTETFNNLGA